MGFSVAAAKVNMISIEDWKCSRRNVMILYYATSFYAGLTYSGYVATEYLYVKDIVHDRNALMNFSVVLGVSRTVAIFCALVGSIYYDFTLNVRGISLTVTLCILLGNILYVLPYSIWLILVGMVLINFDSAACSGIVAEITHIFEEKDLTSTMGLVCAFKTMGMLSGPCLSFAFVKVNILLEKWYLNYTNMPGIVFGALAVPLLIWMIFSLKNLARLYDLKALRESETENSIQHTKQESEKKLPDESDEHTSHRKSSSDKFLNEEAHKIKSVTSYFKTAWDILASRHYGIVVITGAIAIFSHKLLMNLFTVMAVELLDWGVNWLAAIRIITMIGGLVSTVLVIFLSHHIRDFILLYIVIATSILPIVMVTVLPFINNLVAQGTILFVAAFCTGGVDAACHITTIAMVAKLVNSRFQGIAEAVRLAIFHVSYTFSGFLVNIVYENIIIGGSVIGFLIAICAVALVFEIGYYMKKD